MMITEKVRVSVWNNKEREQLKEEFFVDSNKLSNASSELAKKETNDCVVRAFMCALNLSYDQAHAWVKNELKRQDRKGTFMNAYGKNIIGKTKNGKKISFMGIHPSREFMKYSFGSSKPLVNTKYKKATGLASINDFKVNPVAFLYFLFTNTLSLPNECFINSRDG